MLYNDPVVYDWQHISTKALVIGGEEDGLVPDFPPLAENVANELQNSALLLYPESVMPLRLRSQISFIQT